MRILALVMLFGVALPSSAQTGFSTHTYSAPPLQTLTAVDVNRDGYPDIVTSGGPVDVYLNDGHGGFLPRKYAGVFAGSIGIADFNNDGLPDIASCHINSGATASTIGIYLNKGSGSFALSTSAPLNGVCTSVTTGDVDRNGKQDIVVTSYVSDASNNITGNITTFFGSGTGTISKTVSQNNVNVAAQKDPASINGCYLRTASGGDFQQANRVDLVLFGGCVAGDLNGGTLFYGTSDLAGHYTLNEITEDARGFDYFPPYTSDVNGDGKLDVVLIDYQSGPHASWNNSLDFLVNNGSGNFTLKKVFTESSYAASYLSAVFSGAAADFNKDGKWDAVAGFTQSPDCCTQDTPGLAILSPDASGNYVEMQRWKAQAYPYSTITADFNKDGKPDIATIQINSNANTASLVVYLNTGVPACVKPTSPGVHVCSPVSGNTYSSPVNVTAAATPGSGSVVRLELWIDGKKYANYSGSTMNANVPMTTGSHRVVVVEDDSAGGHLNSAPVYFSVN